MEVSPRTIKIYEAEDGNLPFVKWIRSLKDIRAKQAIEARIDRMRSGNFGDHRSVGEGVMELRIHLLLWTRRKHAGSFALRRK